MAQQRRMRRVSSSLPIREPGAWKTLQDEVDIQLEARPLLQRYQRLVLEGQWSWTLSAIPSTKVAGLHVSRDPAVFSAMTKVSQQAQERRQIRTLSGLHSSEPISTSKPLREVPRLNIVIMVVGTQGDAQPFVALGQRLKVDGHRVRLATHHMYRSFVEKHGLEFFPLAGDPKKLSQWMVKTKGRIIPHFFDRDEMLHDIPQKLTMLREILYSTWGACTAPDPVGGKPFTAHAIISNPVTYGHIHCAEALGIPLHIMFPQPWTPTEYFPHPFGGMPYDGKKKRRNALSYYTFDELQWTGLAPSINAFRSEVLGLKKLRVFSRGANLLNEFHVPFAKMWSKALVDKAQDWKVNVDVVGGFYLDQATSYDAPADLTDFLDPSLPAPIFVGFGSMVIEDTASLVKMIVEAALKANVRVLVQSSWSAMTGDGRLPDSVKGIGPCPHDWLLPQMAAVVHHGGAGTVAAGLRFGKPTFVCPFFGDQHFWGWAVHQAGVGPEPTPITELTTEKLVEAFRTLIDATTVEKAKVMAQEMNQEDGVENGLNAFYWHLPTQFMHCDVSPLIVHDDEGGLKDERQVAEVFHIRQGLKVSQEVHAVMRSYNKIFFFTDYSPLHWDTSPRPYYKAVFAAVGALATEIFYGASAVLVEPYTEVKQTWHSHTATSIPQFIGFLIAAMLISIVKAIWLTIYRVFKGLGLFFSLLVYTGCRGRFSFYKQVPMPHAPRVRMPAIDISPIRKHQILKAYRRAQVVRHLFDALVRMNHSRDDSDCCCQSGNSSAFLNQTISQGQANELFHSLMQNPPENRCSWALCRRFHCNFTCCDIASTLDESERGVRLSKFNLLVEDQLSTRVNYLDFCQMYMKAISDQG